MSDIVRLKLRSALDYQIEIDGLTPDRTATLSQADIAALAVLVGSRRAGLKPVLYDPISLFPDADCPVIKSFTELPDLLK